MDGFNIDMDLTTVIYSSKKQELIYGLQLDIKWKKKKIEVAMLLEKTIHE